MWVSGVSLVTWFMLEDQPSPTPWQSGLYYNSPTLAAAQPKPMLTAFEFPFVAYLGKKDAVSVWGRDATSTAQVVAIQVRKGKDGAFKTVARVKTNKFGIFLATLQLEKVTKRYWVRAVTTGAGSSLPFSLTRPSPKLKYGPWGS
jgi:hypothetical protein